LLKIGYLSNPSVAQILLNEINPVPKKLPALSTPAGLPYAVARAGKRLATRLFPPGRDPAFEGIGQVEVTFLSKRFLIGCIKGEEDKAIENAHRFEVDASEVVKAVEDDLDVTRAMLMAGVLAHERITELEAALNFAPASDRVVSFNDNMPDYFAAASALEHLVDVVRESNSYREADPHDQDRRLAELEAGQRLLKSKWISLHVLRATLLSTLGYLAIQFVNAPIGEAATFAWQAIKKLLGID